MNMNWRVAGLLWGVVERVCGRCRWRWWWPSRSAEDYLAAGESDRHRRPDVDVFDYRLWYGATKLPVD